MPVLKFLLDENISRRVFSLLKRKKCDVVSVHSLNLCGIKNGELVLEANREQRILVTFDKDFLYISSSQHHGILLLDIYPARDHVVLPIFERFLDDLKISSLKWAGKIVILRTSGYEIK